MEEKRAQTAAVGCQAAGVWVSKSLRERDLSYAQGDLPSTSSGSAARTPTRAATVYHHALDASPPPGSLMSQSQSPDLQVTSAKLSTMHWGEREVEAWHRREEQRLSYRSDLLAQVRLRLAALLAT